MSGVRLLVLPGHDAAANARQRAGGHVVGRVSHGLVNAAPRQRPAGQGARAGAHAVLESQGRDRAQKGPVEEANHALPDCHESYCLCPRPLHAADLPDKSDLFGLVAEELLPAL